MHGPPNNIPIMSANISRFHRTQVRATRLLAPAATGTTRLFLEHRDAAPNRSADCDRSRATPRQGPRIHQPVIRELNQRERVQLFPELLQRNSSSKRCRPESGLQIRKWRRRWNRPRNPQPQITRSITIERDPVAAQQPLGIACLPQAEEFEIKIPYLLNPAHPVVSMRLPPHGFLQPGSGRFLTGVRRRLPNLSRHLQQPAAEPGDEFVHGLQMSRRRRLRPSAELIGAKGPQCRRVTRHVDGLRSQPGQHHRGGCAGSFRPLAQCRFHLGCGLALGFDLRRHRRRPCARRLQTQS
jgi:hypothetical protein